MAAPDVSELVRAVQAKGQAFTPNDQTSREALYLAAKRLADELQPPIEKVAQLSWHEPTLAAVIRIGIEMRLFEVMAKVESAKTTEELGKLTGADPKLLERFLKHLATSKYVTETAPDTYAPNSVTHVLADPKAQGMFTNCFDGLSTINSRLVEYFKRTGGYQNPIDKDNSIFMYTHGTNLHYFDWVFQPGNEDQATAFQNHMKMKTLGPKWFQTVPVEEILGQAGQDKVLLVDVGGAAGHDLQAFHEAFPNLSGRLILQDRPEMIKTLDAAALRPVEPLGHDFFTPQPIKGANAYYLKMVLHDWPDIQCKHILENLKPALVSGRSKILINEMLIPETGAGWFETSVDMLMLLCHSAHERREKEWRAVIESAGLRITKIWQCGDAPEKLIVVELP